MSDEPRDKQPTQQTQPKKGRPVEIPVPKRGEFEKALKRVSGVRSKDHGADSKPG